MSDRMCPKCGKSLHPIRVARHVLDKCMHCRGLWFDSGELADVLKDAYADEGSFPQEPDDGVAAAPVSANQCPVCRIPLQPVASLQFHGLEMDTCPECQGVWLDLGEFSQIRRHQTDLSSGASTGYPPMPATRSVVMGVVDELHDAAFEQATVPVSPYLRDSHRVAADRPLPHGPEERHISSDSGPWRGKVEVAMKGFLQQTVVSTDLVTVALEILPDRHLEGLHTVAYSPTPPKPTYPSYRRYSTRRSDLNVDHHSPSAYRDLGTLTVHSFETEREFLERLYHEIGHYVYFAVLNLAGQSLWRDHIFPDAEPMSPLAARNAMEAFAEAYTHYVLWPDRMREAHPEQYAFLADGVFLGFRPETARLGVDL